MLEVQIRELSHGPIETLGQLLPGDPALEGMGVRLEEPLEVEGRLQATADGEYFWRGRLTGRVVAECRRCLREIAFPLDTGISVMFSDDPDMADDPSVYPLPARSREIDLRPAIREELALAVPAFPLCREDCAGLCPGCGADLNTGPCNCASRADSN
ncbi:MAG: YceD family protein [Gemmatimonadales bacterium]